MNIVVFLGANEGNDPSLAVIAYDLGRWVAERGDTLVYGGSKAGLMGHLAMGALDAGGKVIGVEPHFFIEQDVQLDSLSELIVTETMAQRKEKMFELGDAFITLPGATGTLEEVAEAMSCIALGLLDATCILLNLGGFYDGLKDVIENMLQSGLAETSRFDRVHFADSIDELDGML